MTTPAEAFARALGTQRPPVPPARVRRLRRSWGALLVGGPLLLLAGTLTTPGSAALRQYGWTALTAGTLGAVQDRPRRLALRAVPPALGPAADLLLPDLPAARLVLALATTPYAVFGLRLLRRPRSAAR